MTSTDEAPSAAAAREAPSTGVTGVTGGMFRAAVTLHTVVVFGQPVFAGVYLSGDIGGLGLHALGADAASFLGLAQAVVGVTYSVRQRVWWPALTSLLLVAAESVQYVAGMDGALWLHLPLGVSLISGLAVLFTVAWTRPLRGRGRGGSDA
jgi:hypothetical protein